MGKFTFTQAVRTARPARIAIAGPSGSGKTFTALTLATAMADKVLGVDTESRTMRLYADLFRFDKCELDTYDPEVLPELLAEAAAAGYGAVVIDSLSHFWMGESGMLEKVDKLSAGKSGSSFNNGWKEAGPIERRMLKALLGYPGHLIVTMRTKTEWVIEANAQGRQAPRKVGTAPEQRKNIEYEFDVFASMDPDNTLVIEKTRCPLLSGGVYKKPTGEIGVTLRDWLDLGAAAPNAQDLRDRAFAVDATVDSLRGLYEQARDAGLLGASVLTPEGRALPLADLLSGRANTLNVAEHAAQQERSRQLQAGTAPLVASVPQSAGDVARQALEEHFVAPAQGQTQPVEWPAEPPADADIKRWRGWVLDTAVAAGWTLPDGKADVARVEREYKAASGGGTVPSATVNDLTKFVIHMQAEFEETAQSTSSAPVGAAA
jgi:shikimate kinase